MKASEIFQQWKEEREQTRPTVVGDLFFHIGNHVLEAQLETGARVLDVSDFKQFLFELANEADRRMA